MRVLLDTNAILDVWLALEPFLEEPRQYRAWNAPLFFLIAFIKMAKHCS
jgi:hypothetical protein